ncbi:PKD domain-containing protein [Neolewinella maritima]|uniref:PKD domain-containing protein n=1 Tax=Neolewinella maritima TaxID=1383882 RepID=UPI001EE925B6|nr:PKD domain-containing protein [Neolewinella maritima]
MAIGLAELSGQAVIRLENLTKVPGSDRGFPADDYYTFQRTLNPVNSVGQRTLHTERSGIRIHNDGTTPLRITRLSTTDTSNFTISGVTIPTGGLSIAAGSSIDAQINFVTDQGEPKRLVTENLLLESNASNPTDAEATLRGAYLTLTEGNNEVSAQQVFQAFGFTTTFGRDSSGELVVRPSSDYPTAQQVDAGREGDMILSSYFVQADPALPIRMIQLSALHAPGGAPTELRDTLSRAVLGSMLYNHGPLYHQTLLPRASNTSEDVAGAFTDRIDQPFQILIAGYRTSGGGLNNLRKDELLGVRVYLARDRNGRVIPNEYIVNQDYIGNNGCGTAGSANCDWNDNTSYIINARPLAVPTSGRIANVTATVGEVLTYSVNGAFDKGYPGNRLSYTATLASGQALPGWITVDSLSGTLRIDAPAAALGDVYPIRVTATDYNLLTSSSSFTLLIDGAADCTVTAGGANNTQVLDCTTGSVQLLGTSSTDTYAWSGPNGFTSAEARPTVTVAGTYVLRGGAGCDRSSTVDVLAASNCDGTPPAENQPPVAIARANPSDGEAPLRVRLRGGNSVDLDGQIVSYDWRWTQGAASGKNVEVVFARGTYCITLTVTDDRGATGADTICIDAGEAVVRQDSVFLEAECAEVGVQWAVDSTASGVTYAAPLENRESDSPPDDAPANRLRFEARNMAEGFYRIAARVAAAGSSSDSYWVRVNDGSWYNWSSGIAAGGEFQWNLRPGEEYFFEGTNTIDVALREAGAQLDKIYLSRSARLPTTAGTLGINCSDTTSVDTTTTVDTTLTSLFNPPLSLELQVYPNPATTNLSLRYVSTWSGPVTLFVIDVHGRRIREQEFRKSATEFSTVVQVADLPQGAYRLLLIEGQRRGVIPFLRL